MADLSKLSVHEIRQQLGVGALSLTPQLLGRLKRDPRQGVRQLYTTLKKRHDRERGEQARLDGMLNFERILWKTGVTRIAGVDEAGMGPLAGPVVAAAVVFPPGTALDGVDDSKRLDHEQRGMLAQAIRESAAGIGIGTVEVGEIDRINIYQAGLLAMRRAVDALPERPEHVLVDARTIPDLDVAQNPFTKGDGINFSIAAASIIAKTHRDALMDDLDRLYPDYGFARHKGYGTPEHQDAIGRVGPCAVHRLSFGIIRELCGEYSGLFYELRDRLVQAAAATDLAAFDEMLGARKADLGDDEHRKLKLMLSRRWKTI